MYFQGLKPKVVVQEIQKPQEIMTLWRILGSSRNVLRLAGISGASAVMLGAYGAHHAFVQPDNASEKDPKEIFDMCNRYHIIHSLALLAAPMARKPLLVSLNISYLSVHHFI